MMERWISEVEMVVGDVEAKEKTELKWCSESRKHK